MTVRGIGISALESVTGSTPSTTITVVPTLISAPPAPSQPIGEFRPPERQKVQRGLASRSWVPVALSFGTVIIVAIALVIYFSQHT